MLLTFGIILCSNNTPLQIYVEFSADSQRTKPQNAAHSVCVSSDCPTLYLSLSLQYPFSSHSIFYNSSFSRFPNSTFNHSSPCTLHWDRAVSFHLWLQVMFSCSYDFSRQCHAPQAATSSPAGISATHCGDDESDETGSADKKRCGFSPAAIHYFPSLPSLQQPQAITSFHTWDGQ